MTSADSLRQVLLRSSHSVRKASQGKSTIFPVIYPPHLHREFRIAWGFSLCCNLTHSHMPDAVPVRRTNGLPRASFRFHLTMDTLAFGYALGAIPCARDFHPLDCAHAWHNRVGARGLFPRASSHTTWRTVLVPRGCEQSSECPPSSLFFCLHTLFPLPTSVDRSVPQSSHSEALPCGAFR